MLEIPTVTVPQALFFDGKWHDAALGALVADPATGSVLIMANSIITADQSVHVGLRLESQTVQLLRAMMGFGVEAGNGTPSDS